MTLNAWTGLQDPSTPKNIREGEPYTDPQFEVLARTYGVWGTAQAALCAEFWQAARRAPSAQAPSAPLTAYTLREIIKKLNANHDEEGWNFGDLVREVEAYHGITQEKRHGK